jgi:hypothetical protein
MFLLLCCLCFLLFLGIAEFAIPFLEFLKGAPFTFRLLPKTGHDDKWTLAKAVPREKCDRRGDGAGEKRKKRWFH